MSDAKPVENKVADAAVALTSPAAAPVVSAKAAWLVRSRKRLLFIAAGTVVGIAGGVYTFKYFTADPGKASGQQTPPVVAQSKPEEPAKPVTPKPDLDVPDIKVPTLDSKVIKPAPVPVLDLELPDVAPPKINSKDSKSVPAPVLDLDIPDIKPPVSDNKDKLPVIVIPPSNTDKKDTKPPTPDPDLFKAPEELPTTVTDKKDKKDTVIRIGGVDPMPPSPPAPMPMKMTDPSPIPKIDLDIPPPPPMPMKMGDPMIPKLDLDIPPPKPMNTGDPPKVSAPTIGPSPMITDPLVIPPTKNKIPDVPTIDPPVIKSPMIGDPPPPPLIGPKPANKDNYDEDWHAQREGDTYAMISQEYLKDVKYAAALEAYNRDRRKPGERIIRVPPPWVLEEQFPNLIGSKSDKPEPKGAASPKLEPAIPAPGERPAPPAATVAGNNEYRVKAEAGETIREIARKIYGDANAWQKLWKLNPDLDPTLPIPSGTTLRLDK